MFKGETWRQKFSIGKRVELLKDFPKNSLKKGDKGKVYARSGFLPEKICLHFENGKRVDMIFEEAMEYLALT